VAKLQAFHERKVKPSVVHRRLSTLREEVRLEPVPISSN
jgi:hypothetical protein